MFCLLHSPKQKIVKFHAQKQIGKSHVIDIFTSEDMENISLCIFQYLTLYYIINNLVPRACDPWEGNKGSGIIRFREESDWPLKWNA
jgi:hypothetical protein